MKTIDELGISPAPWKNNGHGIVSYHKIADDGIFVLTKFNTDANARLIAAAPELYKCLQTLWEYYDHTNWGELLEGRIKSALAKAGGAE